VVQPKDQVSIITAAGVALSTPVATISQQSRTARGVRIVTPGNGDVVAAMARLSAVVEGAGEVPQSDNAGQSLLPHPVPDGVGQPDEHGVDMAPLAALAEAGGQGDAPGNAEEV